MTARDWSDSIEEARREARFWRHATLIASLMVLVLVAAILTAHWADPCIDPAYRELMEQEVQAGR